jgi:hypothetical protein
MFPKAMILYLQCKKYMTSNFTIGLTESNKERSREATSLGVKNSDNFRPILVTMKESCVKMRSYDLLFIQNVTKVTCP